ncbi:hypothetical protein MSPP1_003050 [Malassezia sp. CBS 17886]|nr:hypothetical protein MSPP1_003050 [Malassezia sp. CBS 17886]
MAFFRHAGWRACGKHVFVTGGSQGLGLAVAQQLAAAGANVVVCSRTESKLREAVRTIRAACQSEQQTVAYVTADVSTFEGAARALAGCPFVPDTVVCCAGGAKPGLFVEQGEADFAAAVKTDYWTALATAQAATKAMIAAGVHGRIVFVSSVVGLMGFVGYGQYAPMKYAIRGLAECLRSELQLYGITVQAYFPATILSPGYEEENKTKPELTKEIEGADDQKTPAQCARLLLRGMGSGCFTITDGLVGELLRVSSAGTAPGHSVVLDTLLSVPARLALLTWRNLVADRVVKRAAAQEAEGRAG